ncbi:XdhC family protein [Dactylosporangium cerinum]|uniref:XdhC family protein n=1 Tax=Dactylosporangium cerinum TaxID=1434730 RepID=A0ABV9VYP4_9ACTN
MSTDAERALVAVFDTPVATHLMQFATTLGYRVTLADPDLTDTQIDGHTDIVVTDHDRPELGAVLRDALNSPARWIGVMGNMRHAGPHVAALRALNVPEDEIARVHRPVGLNIGSKTPAEIALATLAGLIADRNGRPGGFFQTP